MKGHAKNGQFSTWTSKVNTENSFFFSVFIWAVQFSPMEIEYVFFVWNFKTKKFRLDFFSHFALWSSALFFGHFYLICLFICYFRRFFFQQRKENEIHFKNTCPKYWYLLNFDLPFQKVVHWPRFHALSQPHPK